MWTIIVAGHLYLLNGQPVSMPDRRACQEFAARVRGECVPQDTERHEERRERESEPEAPKHWVPREVTPGMLVPEPPRRHDDQ